MISNLNLKVMKAQTRIVMEEAIRASELFDKQFETIVYQQFKKGECVNWDMLDNISMYKEFDLPTTGDGKVKSIRHENTNEGDLSFRVIFTPGAILTRHEHDCVELIEVVKGSFDVILGSESAGTLEYQRVIEGESIIVPINLDHQFTNSSKIKGVCNVKYLK